MNVVFRVDASSRIGTGHVMRCRTLARELERRGAKVAFITRAHRGHMGDLLRQDGFHVELLPEPSDGEGDGGYAAWLGVSAQEDAAQTIAALQGAVCDVLAVDHYALDSAWESLLRPHARKLVVIDDLADRSHDCDVLLDQNYSLAGPDRYASKVPVSCRLLLGPSYALLRPEYAKSRQSMASKSGMVKRVLIYMGGADPFNVTGMALEALCAPPLVHLMVDVVVGPHFTNQSELMDLARTRENTQIHGPMPHLADLMARADLAIGAGGATTWERLCMGLPSLVVSIAENQVPACEALSGAGFIHYLGNAHTLSVTAIENATIQFVDAHDGGMGFASTLVDGLGALRVAEVIAPTPVSQLTLRAAQARDVMTYFAWANDDLVRANALHSEQIGLATHIDWFAQRLVSPKCSLWVMAAGGLPVGQVRFELQDGGLTTIDYSLDAVVRGRGWGKWLIALGVQHLSACAGVPLELRATVKADNVASLQTFMSLGFAELAGDAPGLRQFHRTVSSASDLAFYQEEMVN